MALLTDRFGKERAGNYMHTANGRKYWPLEPQADEIYTENIAHHLATQGRFNGATQHKKYLRRIHYSVAEHSVYASILVPPEHALEALMHDAAEHAIGDMIRPLKYQPEFASYFPIEKLNEVAVAERYNLIYPWPASVKKADEMMAAAEVAQLIVKHPDEEFESGMLHDNTLVANIDIAMMDPYVAKTFFMARYAEIIADREKYRPLPLNFKL